MHAEKEYVLIHGMKGSGKSTLAKMINNKLENSGIFILANAVREKISLAFNIDIEELESETTKNIPNQKLYNQTPRKVMQLFATEFAQECFGKDIWCKITNEEILQSKYKYNIIPDMRFEHEYDYFYNEATLIIFLSRDGVYQDEFNLHSSEKGLMHLYNPDNPKHIRLDLPAESTLESLEEYVDAFLIDYITQSTEIQEIK